MASLLLTAAATAFTSGAAFSGGAAAIGLAAGSLGAQVVGGLVVAGAGAIGSIADNMIFGSGGQAQQGPRLSSLSVATASEGSPLRIVNGTMRVPLELIWALSKREVQSTQSAGKGSALGGGQSVTTFQYFGNWAAAMCRGEIDAIGRAWANGEIVDLSELNFRLYTGQEVQTPDPLIVAAEGAAPGFNGVAYLLFEEVLLERFGQAIPQLQVEVVRNTEFAGLRGVLAQLASDFDVSADVSGVIDDTDITGYTIDRPMSFGAAIDPLRRLFRLDIVERPDGVLIRSRSEAPVAELLADDLAARPDQGPITVRTAQRRQLPERATLQWIDQGRDFQPATSSFRRPGAARGREIAIEMPAAISDSAARRLCTEMVVNADDGRASLSFSGGPSMLVREPGDVVTVTDDRGTEHLAQIERMVIGSEIEVEARRVSARPGLVRGKSGRAPFRNADPVPDIPVVHFLDLAMLTDGEANPHQPWIAADATNWRGVTVYRDEGAGFSAVQAVEAYAQIGALLTPLAAGVTDAVDNVNTVSLEIRRGAFSSVDPAALDESPINSIAIQNASGEWEILQFASASMTGPSDWELSGLRRGRRGTEHAMGAAGNAPVVVLGDGLVKLPILPEQIGLNFDYRFGPSPLAQDDPKFVQESRAFAAKGLRPYSPGDLDATQDGADEITITWTKRARISTDPASVPETHTVRIYDGASVVRTFAANAGTSEIYSVADQTTDFGGAQSSIEFGITPATPAYGDGIEARHSVTF